jgi:hypothetical protein
VERTTHNHNDHHNDHHNDQRIIRYLLNELPDEDQARFEEAYLADGGLFEQVRAVEEELIEDYVKGNLSGPENLLFERHYLASEQRRARIENARHLVQVCSLELPAETATGDGVGSKFSSIYSSIRSSTGLFAKPRLALGFGAAAALLIILGLGLVNEMLRLRDRLAITGGERAALEQRVKEAEQQLAHERDQLDEERKRSIALREELGDVSGRLDRLEQDLARSQTPKNRIVFLALAPGVRDINKPARAVISDETRFVELRVNLERQEKLHPYRVVVKTVDEGREIWGREGIKLQQSISEQYFVVRVPADRFRAVDGQDFMLILSAPTAGGKDYEELEICYFQVIVK